MLLNLEAVGLAGLAVVLAGPAPAALARARWPMRSPRAALLLWQAIGLGGGLAILGAGLTLAAARIDDYWLPGLAGVPTHYAQLGAVGWFGVGVALSVGAWLAIATGTSTVRVLRARRAHRRRLDLIAGAVRVGAAAGGRGGVEVTLVEHPRAVAYCLPGLRPRVVLSRGMVGALDERELGAVLAHERAHARGHHDLVTQPFTAWAQTFPFLPTAARAVTAVRLLVEMLADDAALRRCAPQDLRGALRHLASERFDPAEAIGPGLERDLAARVARLDSPTRTLPRLWSASIYAAAGALVVLPPLILVFS